MPRKKSVPSSNGKLSFKDKLKMINKLAGGDVAHDLTQENPTDVYDWIPTSSTWLDAIVCRGKKAGIPVGRITELAGLSGTGKSYMAAQISGNAQRKGYNVYYFDSESAISSEFLEKCGCILEEQNLDVASTSGDVSTGPCIEYALNQRVVETICMYGLADRPQGIMALVLQTVYAIMKHVMFIFSSLNSNYKGKILVIV